MNDNLIPDALLLKLSSELDPSKWMMMVVMMVDEVRKISGP